MKPANPKYQVRNESSKLRTSIETLKKIGWKADKIVFVPVSGLYQRNISQKYYEWYNGPTLLEAISAVVIARKVTGPFRLAVLVIYEIF